MNFFSVPSVVVFFDSSLRVLDLTVASTQPLCHLSMYLTRQSFLQLRYTGLLIAERHLVQRPTLFFGHFYFRFNDFLHPFINQFVLSVLLRPTLYRWIGYLYLHKTRYDNKELCAIVTKINDVIQCFVFL